MQIQLPDLDMWFIPKIMNSKYIILQLSHKSVQLLLLLIILAQYTCPTLITVSRIEEAIALVMFMIIQLIGQILPILEQMSQI
ncbi:hypothetical protein EBZ37_06550 [bacterium]|nr:hypothetical protein [bacterium]